MKLSSILLEATCPIRGEHYGGIPSSGGYTNSTEYEIGAVKIAEAAHCILGSIARMQGDKTHYGEIEHIKEELGIIKKSVVEYAKQIKPYMLDLETADEYRVEYIEKSIASIKKVSPKLEAKAKMLQKKMDKSADPVLYNVAYAAYEVVIQLAKAMSASVKGKWQSAFTMPSLKKSIDNLEKEVRGFQ